MLFHLDAGSILEAYQSNSCERCYVQSELTGSSDSVVHSILLMQQLYVSISLTNEKYDKDHEHHHLLNKSFSASE